MTNTAAPSLRDRDQIVNLEEKEEARVQKALADVAEAKMHAERESDEKKKMAEEKAKSEAQEELKRYKDSDLQKILAESEAQSETDAKELGQKAKKRIPAVIDELVETVTGLQF